MPDVTARNVMLKLNEWRKIGVNCDVILIIAKEEFPTHKSILAAAIEFFNTLFTGNFAEKGKTDITLKDVNPKGFRLILDYIYTEEINIDCNNFEQVLSVANYYQIECLMKKLFDYFESNISINNAFYCHRLADSVGIKRLKQIAKKFVRKNFLSCSDSAAFLDATYPNLLECIGSPLKNELDRFKIIMKWIQNDSNERSGYLADLIKHVCFADISNDEIVDEILEYQLVINDLDIIKAIKKKKKTENTMHIYGMNGSSLIKVDIVNSIVEATHEIVKTEMNYDKFQILCVADVIYVSIFRKGEGNRLYRCQNSRLKFLNVDNRNQANGSLVYSEKHKTIYMNDNVSIYSYNLDTKIYIFNSINNADVYEPANARSLLYDNKTTDRKSSTSESDKLTICGPLVCYNDLIYTTVSSSNGLMYILQYDPCIRKFYLKSQLTKCSADVVSAVFDDKMFIVSSNTVQMYDITDNHCTLIEETEQTDISYCSLIGQQKRLYLIRKTWDLIDVYDTSKMNWTEAIDLNIDDKSIFNMK